MNKLLLFACTLNLAGLAFLCWRELDRSATPELPASPRPVAHSYPCELVRVVDANTVVLHVDLGFNTWMRDLTVHLAGVDSPSQKATAARDLTAILESETRERKLVLDASADPHGSFNRWFGVLYADGVNLNVLMQGHVLRKE